METLSKPSFDSSPIRALHEARDALQRGDIQLPEKPSTLVFRRQTAARNLALQMQSTYSEWVNRNINPLIPYLTHNGETKREIVLDEMHKTYDVGLNKTTALFKKMPKNTSMRHTSSPQDTVIAHTAHFVTTLRACERVGVPPEGALKIVQHPEKIDARMIVRLANEEDNLPPDEIADTVLAKALRDEIIERMTHGKYIHWEKVPRDGLRELLKKAAQQIGIPVSMLKSPDLQDTAFDFLNGKPLDGLYQYAKRSGKKKVDQPPMEFLRKEAGITITIEDLVTYLRTKPAGEVKMGRDTSTCYQRPTYARSKTERNPCV